ncbi:MAG: twin-arginine translocation signal domain-containing protein, partial [Acidobacteriota bacterium]|nr:twin-arginine translocation signal domain-containing protein [Acidobacteriota bacterium]
MSEKTIQPGRREFLKTSSGVAGAALVTGFPAIIA